MTVSLFLMGKKGLNVLARLVSLNKGLLIESVIAARDKNVCNDYYDEIKKVCIKSEICFYDKNDSFIVSSQYCIAISWRWIISLNSNSQLIVLHDSILPKYRGFAPLVNMLINKESRIGVTAIIADDDFDKGDIVAQKSISVLYPMKIIDAIDLISLLYEEIICDIFETIENNVGLCSIPQNESEASYSLWRDEEDYRINWSSSASDILQFIYSVGYPYKGASTICEEKILRIYDCELYEDVEIENRTPGKVLFHVDGFPVVVCGVGLLKITQLYDCYGNLCLPLIKFRLKFK